jgi:hypothetical protein
MASGVERRWGREESGVAVWRVGSLFALALPFLGWVWQGQGEALLVFLRWAGEGKTEQKRSDETVYPKCVGIVTGNGGGPTGRRGQNSLGFVCFPLEARGKMAEAVQSSMELRAGSSH